MLMYNVFDFREGEQLRNDRHSSLLVAGISLIVNYHVVGCFVEKLVIIDLSSENSHRNFESARDGTGQVDCEENKQNISNQVKQDSPAMWQRTRVVWSWNKAPNSKGWVLYAKPFRDDLFNSVEDQRVKLSQKLVNARHNFDLPWLER